MFKGHTEAIDLTTATFAAIQGSQTRTLTKSEAQPTNPPLRNAPLNTTAPYSPSTNEASSPTNSTPTDSNQG